MIAVDTNILVYGFNERARLHEGATQVLRGLAEGAAAWSIPIFVIGEFLRVVTNPRGPMSRPAATSDAMRAIDDLLMSPSVKTLMPGRRYLPILRGLLSASNAKGNEIFDAQIAAVCLEHGATTILTNDPDFRQFPGITVKGL